MCWYNAVDYIPQGLNPQVFKLAAKIVRKKDKDLGYDGCCSAIRIACGKLNVKNYSSHKTFFENMIRIDSHSPGSAYWMGPLTLKSSFKRAEALLLCAEVIK